MSTDTYPKGYFRTWTDEEAAAHEQWFAEQIAKVEAFRERLRIESLKQQSAAVPRRKEEIQDHGC